MAWRSGGPCAVAAVFAAVALAFGSVDVTGGLERSSSPPALDQAGWSMPLPLSPHAWSGLASSVSRGPLDAALARFAAGRRHQLRPLLTSYRVTTTPAHPPAPAWLTRHRSTLPVVITYAVHGDTGRHRTTGTATVVRGRSGLTVESVSVHDPDLWDVAPVTAAFVGRSAGVVPRESGWSPSLVAHVAASAAASVRRAWPNAWDGRAVVELVGSSTQFERLLGDGYARYAGVARTRDGLTRVLLDPTDWFATTDQGRSILLRHELTHVAQASVPGTSPPHWLVEGTAELVAYEGSGLSTAVVAPDLMADLANGWRPAALPGEADFGPRVSSARLQRAYERSWSLCRALADRFGLAPVLRVYVRASELSGSPARRALQAVDEVLGLDRAHLQSTWRSWLAAQS